MKKVLIIGGGLSGLITAVNLSRSGIRCLVVERNAYPFHKVCGEYVSNEAMPFLKSINILPGQIDRFPRIKKLCVSACNGRSGIISLDLGGIGISRFTLDHHIYNAAKALGAEFLLNTTAENIKFDSDRFMLTCNGSMIEADVVVGAYGKRSRLDRQMQRNHVLRTSPYVAVKYHVLAGFPADLIALHNFEGGYCGVVRVEDGITNVCYLVRRDRLKAAGNISALEEEIGRQNHLLQEIFFSSERIWERPLVINEISFETKTPVEQHVLMCGDAAGMIVPACGNGMAMAIHAGKLVSEIIINYCNGRVTRAAMEEEYRRKWRQHFSRRLWMGRRLQRLFGARLMSGIAVDTITHLKPVASWLIRRSHGQPF
ncbi:MAG TPA: NAD(P)/FAD-dependent oxidoreductase [Cyclobacteriaceae bacterium]|nr:NAD(P)/FAD-dependent oxidoreductase [Cyclobacteriaceae bacterium]